ncbi:MAG: WD40 repeat-like protein [Piptocephalis tieghemiana]|nr:MAG: WD40 repeat-like protein [Piptocephalis tieghemiana]
MPKEKTLVKKCFRHRHLTTLPTPPEHLIKEVDSLPCPEDRAVIQRTTEDYTRLGPASRQLLLEHLLSVSCIPQLSFLSRSLPPLLRIDIVGVVPVEISHRILSHLDAQSLCRAACVSRRWRALANDDSLWKRLCAQHIDRKCRKCGWGLPMLLKQPVRPATPTQNPPSGKEGVKSLEAPETNTSNPTPTPVPAPFSSEDDGSSAILPPPASLSPEAILTHSHEVDPEEEESGPRKRTRISSSSSSSSSRTSSEDSLNPPPYAPASCVPSTTCSPVPSPDLRPTSPPSPPPPPPSPPRSTRSWKDIYAERLLVERRWRKGLPKIHRLRAHIEGVMCLQATNDLLISGSYDGTVRVWDWRDQRCLRVLRGHQGCVRALQFDGAKLVTAGMDRTIRIWDWRSGVCRRILEGSADAVATVAFEGQVVVSGGADGVVRVWDAASGECWALRGHTDWVNCVAIWRGRWVLSGSDDATVRMWDLATRKLVRVFQGHSGQVQSLALAPPIASGSEDKPSSSSSSSSLTKEGGIKANDPIPLPPPSSWPRLVTGALDNTVRVWDVGTGKEERTLFGHVEGVWCVVADRLRIVSGSNDRMVKVWDLETGTCIRTLEGHRMPVNCVSLGDSWVASGGDDCEIRVHDFTEGSS